MPAKKQAASAKPKKAAKPAAPKRVTVRTSNVGAQSASVKKAKYDAMKRV